MGRADPPGQAVSARAAPLVDEYLANPGSPAGPSAEEANWLRSLRADEVWYLGSAPRAGDLRHFVEARRTLGEHALDPGKLRVAVVHEPGTGAMLLSSLLVVFDRGGDEANMRLAYALAASVKASRPRTRGDTT